MRLPSLSIAFNYVLILEWLDENDERTGQHLEQFLQGMGVSTCLVHCQQADDVRGALARALVNIPERGIPLVHIESHGSDPLEETDVRDADFGMNAAPGLKWMELGDWLAPLNEASEYKLLVVGATCFGFAAIAAMKIYEHIAPFAATVGFSTEVDERSVRDVMKELYRSICRRREPLQVAVESANWEVHHAGETLKLTSSPMLAIRVLRGVYEMYRPGVQVSARVAALIDRVREAGMPMRQDLMEALPEYIGERRDARIQEAWNAWFSYDAQQEQEAYCLKLEWVEQADLDMD
jgi:hypothetical protein